MDYNDALEAHRKMRVEYNRAQILRRRLRTSHRALLDVNVLAHNPTQTQKKSTVHDSEEAIMHALDHGSTYLVGYNIFEGVYQASRKMSIETRITPDMFPTPQGVMFLDGVLGLTDKGRTGRDLEAAPLPSDILIRGLIWNINQIVMSPNEPWDRSPGFLLAMIEETIDPKLRKISPIDVTYYASWRYNETIRQFHNRLKKYSTAPPVDDDTPYIMVSMGGFMAAMLRFMQQRIVVPHRTLSSKSHRRTIERTKWDHDAHVNIIKLRKAHERWNPRDPHDSTPRDWSCSWGVRGHWRDQPCGPGRKQIKQIWIDPYIKGDTTKPLRVKTGLFAVTR